MLLLKALWQHAQQALPHHGQEQLVGDLRSWVVTCCVDDLGLQLDQGSPLICLLSLQFTLLLFQLLLQFECSGPGGNFR